LIVQSIKNRGRRWIPTVDTRNRDGHALDSEPPTPAVSTRMHDGVASDAQAAAAAIIRENQGG
jgi:membrane fusion protein (multidrug efflux system)